MTITGHLTELRRRLFLCALVFVGFSVLAFIFRQKFVDAAMQLSPQFDLVYLSPSELVGTHMKLSFIAGLVISAPFILWQLWAFISPGLLERERRSAGAAIVAGFLFFLIGALFCYFVMLPMTLAFLYDFNGSTEITATISFDRYMSFVLGMLVAFGVVFEMPVLSFLLSRLGILNPKWLMKGRKYAVLVIFIIGAAITPPDVISQFMTAIPMLGLYELSILVSRLAYRQREAAEEEDDEEEEETETAVQ